MESPMKFSSAILGYNPIPFSFLFISFAKQKQTFKPLLLSSFSFSIFALFFISH